MQAKLETTWIIQFYARLKESLEESPDNSLEQ